MALREQSAAIAVIGVAGSGKSTFINLASGSNLPARRSLGRRTVELESSTFSLDGRSVTLIDTPGFGDSTAGVLDVLKLISDYFARLYSRGIKLAGVVYMHCITEDHMGGPSRHSFCTFSKFCGDASLRDVVIVAGECPGDRKANDGDTRGQESAHKDGCFMNAIDKGARILCHDGSRASAHAILRNLIYRRSGVPPVQMDASDETADHTTTGLDAARELRDQGERHAKAFGEPYQGIDATLAQDEEAKNLLEEIEGIGHDLERMVTKSATENSRLEGESRQYKDSFSVQGSEAELRIRLLKQEREAKEVVQVGPEWAEAQLAAEPELQEREREEHEPTERERQVGEKQRMVTEFSIENPVGDNRQHRDAASPQRTEGELRLLLWGRERKVLVVTEDKRGIEVLLATERTLEKESLRIHARQRYGKLVVFGVVIFAMVYASQLMLNGPTTLLS